MMEIIGDIGSLQTMVRRSLADPSRAIIVSVLGMFGVYRELMRPGRVLPGMVGAVAVFLGVQALLRHSLTALGCTLLLLAGGAAALQARARYAWMPALASAILAFFGARFLIEARPVSWPASFAVAALAVTTAVLVRYAWLGWRRKRSV